MIAYRFRIILVVVLIGITGCASTHSGGNTKIDLVPMYGEVDRSANPELRTGDERFIESVTKEFGSREEASKQFVDKGFRYYNEDKFDMAMRRFNQAWLLNPDNPEVYQGFAAIIYDKGNNCESMRFLDLGLEKDLSQLGPSLPGFLADAGMITSHCAMETNNSKLIEKSDKLFHDAEEIKPSAYLYDKWWQALYWQGEYSDAWERVFLMRKYGGSPHEMSLNELRKKMPEPRK